MSTFLGKLFLLLALPTFLLSAKHLERHPFHVSTTEISYNAKSKSLEITCRIFSDDFEDILSKRFKSKIDLHQKHPEKELNTYIKSYLESCLKFKVNGKTVKANYLGFENDHEATNIYLEITGIPIIKQFNLSNGILYDLFDDQMNILHFERNGTRKSTKVNYPEREMSFIF